MRLLHFALAAFVAGALLVVGATAATPSLTPIPWSTSTQGAPFLVAGAHSVWISALKGAGTTTVWRVEPALATVRSTPITTFVQDLFPGAGSLWMSQPRTLEGDRLVVDWVDIKHGYRLVRKAVPETCGIGDGGHSVVYRGRLWLTCPSFGVYVYAPHHRWPIDRVPARKVLALLPAAHGLWLAGTSQIRAIAGPDKDVAIPCPRPFAVAGDYASNVGWAVAGPTIWAIGWRRGSPALVRIDLRRRTSRVYPIVVPGRRRWLGGGIAAVGKEVWVGDELRARLIRYSQGDPGRPLGYIALPGHGIAKDGYLSVQRGAGAVWVEVERPNGLRLFRVAMH